MIKQTQCDKRSNEVISGSYIKGLGTHLKDKEPNIFPANLGFAAEVIIGQRLYFTSKIHDTPQQALDTLNNWIQKYIG